jgi:hypothetical protein
MLYLIGQAFQMFKNKGCNCATLINPLYSLETIMSVVFSVFSE